MISASALTMGLLAMLASIVSMLVLRRLAPRLGLMDQPGGRKRHERATPAVGGLAIALGCALAVSGLGKLGPPEAALALGGAILLASGGLDDLFDLAWPWKVVAQVAAAMVLIGFGGVEVNSIDTALGFNGRDLGFLAAPFTILATVGLVNAINMIDGVDGLAGAAILTALAMLTGAALYAGNAELARTLTLLCGGVIAFLGFNLRLPGRPRARVFLGNAGSEFLGLAVAWGCFRLTQTPSHPVTPVLAPFLIAVPVIDCLTLVLRRIAARRSPFSADRDHLHHVLADAGLSPTAIVLLVTLASLAIGLVAALCLLQHVPQPLFIVAFLTLTALYVGVSRRRARFVALVRGLILGQDSRPASAIKTIGVSERLGA
jgi:UDP-GlcNAc:undecaprenyl-phosphate/decaprenyl-phosphate GlcNAc-1-phosphate transferase